MRLDLATEVSLGSAVSHFQWISVGMGRESASPGAGRRLGAYGGRPHAVTPWRAMPTLL